MKIGDRCHVLWDLGPVKPHRSGIVVHTGERLPDPEFLLIQLAPLTPEEPILTVFVHQSQVLVDLSQVPLAPPEEVHLAFPTMGGE